jgi:hypothetical protein
MAIGIRVSKGYSSGQRKGLGLGLGLGFELGLVRAKDRIRVKA